ncbi:hypothetical protein CWN26_25915 [Klebsiella pneumoniae]|nr:hypothetical protein CWN26_25915 [Klebsiella pneumoniae]
MIIHNLNVSIVSNSLRFGFWFQKLSVEFSYSVFLPLIQIVTGLFHTQFRQFINCTASGNKTERQIRTNISCSG